ncbi:MAG: trehalose-phosphatase [Cyclobacteriaceae bacterium]|jgi:trehalose 6-phosphate synthase/phosphatase|nr:trehalose-phosphatase [Cytophagales bacterium]HNP77255.1 trehalose-phosphatase [Cyclobacteriaceae bacterium]
MASMLNQQEITSHYLKSFNRLILLDYDGTLVPFVDRPNRVFPDESVVEVLATLGLNHRNRVVLISGRDREYMEATFNSLPITLVAEHGAFAKNPGEGWNCLYPPDTSTEWMPSAIKILKALTFEFDGSYFEQKSLSLVWHYRGLVRRLSDQEKDQIIHALWFLQDTSNFDILDSQLSIELRTKGIQKGLYLNQWNGHLPFDFVMAIGDSETDEDLFNQLGSEAFCIRVGNSNTTAARLFVPGQQDVIPFLKSLAHKGNTSNSAPRQSLLSGSIQL